MARKNLLRVREALYLACRPGAIGVGAQSRAKRRNPCGKRRSLLFGLPLIAIMAFAPATHAGVQYGECDWKWVMSSDGLASSAVAYDDQSWAVGCAPFVRSWGCAPPGTEIPQDGSILVRKHIFNASASTVIASFKVRARWFAAVYANGAEITSGSLVNECLSDDAWDSFYAMHGTFALNPGDNVFLVRHVSTASVVNGVTSYYGGYLDIQVTGGDLPTPNAGRTWGRLKVIYR